jgi:hypothetical protein
VSWFLGILLGDGYIDDRHIEIHNSSKTIISEVVRVIKEELNFPLTHIKVDVYSNNCKSCIKWSKFLKIPLQNVKTKKNLSPWTTNLERVRIRIASKDMVNLIKEKLKNKEKWTIKNKRLFIKGLFDAEAHVDYKGYIEFKQKADPKKIKMVKNIFKELTINKIKCTKPKIKNDTTKQKQDIYFCVKDLEKYNNLIGFIDRKKQETLNLLIEISKLKKDPTEEEILNVFGKKDITIAYLMKELKCSYYKTRKVLIFLSKKRLIIKNKLGNKHTYLVVR